MRLVKCSLAGLVLAGILAMMPAAAFIRGGGGQGGRGGEHAFVGGGHASGGFTGRGFSRGFSGTRGYPLGRFSGREDHGRFGDRGFRDHRVLFWTGFPGLFIGLPTILTITPTWITDRITTINLGTIQPRLCNRSPSDPPSTMARLSSQASTQATLDP